MKCIQKLEHKIENLVSTNKNLKTELNQVKAENKKLAKSKTKATNSKETSTSNKTELTKLAVDPFQKKSNNHQGSFSSDSPTSPLPSSSYSTATTSMITNWLPPQPVASAYTSLVTHWLPHNPVDLTITELTKKFEEMIREIEKSVASRKKEISLVTTPM